MRNSLMNLRESFKNHIGILSQNSFFYTDFDRIGKNGGFSWCHELLFIQELQLVFLRPCNDTAQSDFRIIIYK
ncbi:MAG TPA: hypothetical protein DEO70_07255 [Bacteroidales bacterium]|nr:MAG: hypothetical protein A2X11_06875 [Bacteroidetes bacterium GWE2_42_24]OFY25973.1 MAG: hypothetical protein A2X09_04720 [Bacteroidetes bacterium GWF2_43_11]HBZ66618.1 hypothetical protein [Bacteroidales bacterium]